MNKSQLNQGSKVQSAYLTDGRVYSWTNLHRILAVVQIFLHTGYGYLIFYPGIENLILPMLSYLSREGCTLVVLELTHMVVK